MIADSDYRALTGVTRLRAWSLTVVAMVAMAVSLIDRQVLAALAHTVTSALQVSDPRYGWWSTAFALSYFLGSIPTGRFVARFGPRMGLAVTLLASSLVIALHSVVEGFWSVLVLRVALGFAIAASFPCATQAIHRVLPFRDRARAIGLLYLGNSLGSALSPPLAATIESHIGWRHTFTWIALGGIAWLPLWIALAFTGGARQTLDAPPLPPAPAPVRDVITDVGATTILNLGGHKVRLHPGVVRGIVVVAAAAPITALVLLWGAKYLIQEHHLSQSQIGDYLWMPALFSGWGSVLFGELIARRAPTRDEYRPPRLLLVVATVLASTIVLVPAAEPSGPWPCIVLASLAMAGAGGLYTVATSDMLVRAPRGTVAMTTGFTALTQCLVYMVANPLIGTSVQTFGNYRLALVTVGVCVLPGSIYWLMDATRRTAPST